MPRRHPNARPVPGLAFLALLLSLAVSCSPGGDERTAPTGRDATTTPRPLPNYQLDGTSRCLGEQGLTVGKVAPRDPRLQALGDLAQRNSIEAVLDEQPVGLAFGGNVGDVSLLADLLRVPDDAYTIVLNRNVLLMYQPAAQRAFVAAVDCLRT